MLTYPGFSVVFIQTFSVHHTKEFILPEDALAQMNKEYKGQKSAGGAGIGQKMPVWEKAPHPYEGKCAPIQPEGF